VRILVTALSTSDNRKRLPWRIAEIRGRSGTRKTNCAPLLFLYVDDYSGSIVSLNAEGFYAAI